MLTGFRIAIVEDDEIMGTSIVQRLELEGADVVWFKHVVRALGGLRTPRAPIDAVICDIRLPDGSGEELFATLCQTASPPPFLFITGHAGVEQAVRLMQAGAADYVTKPFKMAVFLDRLAMLLRKRRDQDLPPLLGVTPAARRAHALIDKAAGSSRPVLLRGGPGTGKGLIARRIHALSDRSAAPFVEINLARDPNDLAALSGPEGGVKRTGEGVLFLNAIGRFSEAAQNALFEAMDAGFAGRLISACGNEIETLVADGGFRADLFVRLAASEIAIPPLGQRSEDALWLLRELFESHNAARTDPLQGISSLCEAAVRDHAWPGGGREVRSRLMRAIETAAGPLLLPVDLFPERLAGDGSLLTLAEARDAAERRQIVEALERTNGQIGRAARLLKVSRTTLWEKMHKLGLRSGDD